MTYEIRWVRGPAIVYAVMMIIPCGLVSMLGRSADELVRNVIYFVTVYFVLGAVIPPGVLMTVNPEEGWIRLANGEKIPIAHLAAFRFDRWSVTISFRGGQRTRFGLLHYAPKAELEDFCRSMNIHYIEAG